MVFCHPVGQDRTVIGTTDTFYDGRPEDVHADAERRGLPARAGQPLLPRRPSSTPDDVLATWAGLRPLLKPDADVATASDVSREHHILERPGLVTIAGGKLTTYRRMAAEVVERAGEQLGDARRRAATETRPLPGAAGVSTGYAGVHAAGRASSPPSGVVDAAVAKHLANTYGARAPSVVARVEARAGARRAARSRAAVHRWRRSTWPSRRSRRAPSTTCSARRVPLLLRARDQGLGGGAAVAARMGALLGWAAAEEAQELDRYAEVVATTRKFRSR